MRMSGAEKRSDRDRRTMPLVVNTEMEVITELSEGFDGEMVPKKKSCELETGFGDGLGVKRPRRPAKTG